MEDFNKKNNIDDYTDDELLNKPVIMMNCLSYDGKQILRLIKRFGDDIFKKYPQLYTAAVKQNPETIRYVPDEIKIRYMEMSYNAVIKDKYLIKYIPDEVIDHYEDLQNIRMYYKKNHQGKEKKNETKITDIIKKNSYTITEDDVEIVKELEKKVYGEKRAVLKNCYSFYDIARVYRFRPENLEIIIGRNENWYMIADNANRNYSVFDFSLVESNLESDDKLNNRVFVSIEMAKELFHKIVNECDSYGFLKAKQFRINQRRNNSGINTRMLVNAKLISNNKDDISYETSKINDSLEVVEFLKVKPNIDIIRERLKNLDNKIKEGLEER